MGQRHQVFLIARVHPHRDPEVPTYRCVAAFHHQFCYGTLPLRSMHRFLRLLAQPENAAIVRAELREVDAHYRRAHSGEPMPCVPCPYSVSLVATAWTTNLDATHGLPQFDGVALRHCVLDARMGCWDGDNNDGISIVDVTDPLRPAYCFMTSSYPLSAYEYLGKYYPLAGAAERASDRDYLAIILDITGIPLLTAEILQEAWPRERFHARTPQQDYILIPSGCATSISSPDYARRVRDTACHRLWNDPKSDEAARWYAALKPGSPPSSTGPKLIWFLLRHPSVFNFALVTAPESPPGGIENVPTSPQTSGASGASGVNSYDEDKASVPAAMEYANTTLRRLSPFPDEYVDTLVMIFTSTKQHFADLSGYDLCSRQIGAILARCSDIDSLDISQNPRIGVHDIPALVDVAPSLRRLNVSGCSAINGDELLELVRMRPALFRSLEAIVHPVFLTIEKPPNFPIAFTFICAGVQDVSGVALPMFTPTQVLQALCQLLPIAWHSGESLLRAQPGLVTLAGRSDQWDWYMQAHRTLPVPGSLGMSSPMLSYSAFSSGSQPPGQCWSDRPVVGVPLHPYSIVSPGPEGSWAFYLDWSAPAAGPQKWAFIRYGPGAGDEGEDGQTELNATTEDPVAETQRIPSYARRGRVYDLRGFVRHTTEEGRPPPAAQLVAQLEEVLYMRQQFDGELVCPLMYDEDTPTASTIIPQIAARDAHGDFMQRIAHKMLSQVHRSW